MICFASSSPRPRPRPPGLCLSGSRGIYVTHGENLAPALTKIVLESNDKAFVKDTQNFSGLAYPPFTSGPRLSGGPSQSEMISAPGEIRTHDLCLRRANAAGSLPVIVRTLTFSPTNSADFR